MNAKRVPTAPKRGIRYRLAASLALAGMLVSVIFFLVTNGTISRYLNDQREKSALEVSRTHSRFIGDAITAGGVAENDPAKALDQLELTSGSSALLVVGSGDSKAVESKGMAEEQIPKSVARSVRKGKNAQVRIDLDGEGHFLVGLAIEQADAQYYEATNFEDLEDSLNTIRRTLFAAASATTLLSLAAGIWAGKNVLGPLEDMGETAEKIAAGDFSARLDAKADPDLMKLADSFNRMVDSLKERITRDAQFVGDVSHELRSPVTTLATAAELLQNRRDHFEPKDQRALDLLVAEVGRFQRVVEELLELSRGDAGANELVTEPVFVDALVDALIAVVASGDVELDIDPDVIGKPIMLDKRRVERIMVNLFTNARTHGDGLKRVGVRKKGKVLRMEVEDNGPGIPLEDRDRIFDRFYRGAAAGRRGRETGAGLGLALVREHVKLHGGKVWVEPISGRAKAGPKGGGGPGAGAGAASGSRFVVELPWTPA